MTTTKRRAACALAALAATAMAATAAAPAFADFPGNGSFPSPGAGAVFVQTDGLAANQIVVYDRRSDGTLAEAGTYATGGRGGQLTGSVVDHTASQGSLTYDREAGLLFAVNAGSDTVSVFSVFGDRLALRQVVGSGGAFPVSVTARGNEVFVLNGEDGGSLQGYALLGGRLLPLPWLHRSLGLATGAQGDPEEFTHTPGEVAFTPDGTQLVVTTKAGGQSIDLFRVFPSGAISATPVVTPDATVPFAVSFDPQGHLLVAEAAGALATFRIEPDGALAELSTVGTEQAATCWLTPAAGYYYTSNAGSATLTGFSDTPGGQLTLLGDTATHPGTVDGASAGSDLYVQGGAEGTVDEFRVEPGGGLASLGSVLVEGAVGGEGIAAG